MELSNKRAERSIKPFVIGWKNRLLANTPRGARTSPVICSLVETASENGLNPLDYLRFALERLRFIDSATDLRESSEVIDSLLPWSESVKSALQPQPPPPLDQAGLS